MGFIESMGNLGYDPTEGEFVPSGVVVLDAILSQGRGIPLGLFIEIASDSGLGKSTILLYVCKCLCAQGYNCLYLDIETGVNDSQIDGIGLRPYYGKKFILKQPATYDACDEILKVVVEDGSGVDFLFLDSVSMLLPAKIVSESVESIQPGLDARLTNTLLKKYKNAFRQRKITVFFINQMRVKFNFRGVSTRDAAGGEAQKFMMDVRLRLSLKKKLERKTKILGESKEGDIPYGSDNLIWAIKTRYAPPFIPGPITVLFGKGVSNLASYALWIKAKGFVRQGGAGYFKIKLPGMEEEETVRGVEAFQEWIKGHLNEIKQIVADSGGFSIIGLEESIVKDPEPEIEPDPEPEIEPDPEPEIDSSKLSKEKVPKEESK